MSHLRRPIVAVTLPPALAALVMAAVFAGHYSPGREAIDARTALARANLERVEAQRRTLSARRHEFARMEVYQRLGDDLSIASQARSALLADLAAPRVDSVILQALERTGRDAWRATFEFRDLARFVDYVEQTLEEEHRPDRVEVSPADANHTDRYTVTVKF